MDKHKNQRDYNRFKESIKDLSKWVDIDENKYIEEYRSSMLHVEQVEKQIESLTSKRASLINDMYNMKLKPLRDVKLDVYEFIKHKPNKRQVLDFLFTEGFIDNKVMDGVVSELWENRGAKIYQYSNPYEERG
jgi:hypothetical protein